MARRVHRSRLSARRRRALKPRGGAKSALNARARHIPRVQEITDPEIAQVLKLYEEAMRRFNKQNFRRAKELLEKVTAGPSRELAERARVHLAICEQRLQRSAPVSLRSAEDHYHYAVARMNVSDYGTARQHLEKAVRLAPKADHIHYALAALASLEGKAEEALEHLARAIKLQPQNRTQARKDEDFRFLEGDPRFQSLLQPEAAEARA